MYTLKEQQTTWTTPWSTHTPQLTRYRMIITNHHHLAYVALEVVEFIIGKL